MIGFTRRRILGFLDRAMANRRRGHLAMRRPPWTFQVCREFHRRGFGREVTIAAVMTHVPSRREVTFGDTVRDHPRVTAALYVLIAEWAMRVQATPIWMALPGSLRMKYDTRRRYLLGGSITAIESISGQTRRLKTTGTISDEIETTLKSAIDDLNQGVPDARRRMRRTVSPTRDPVTRRVTTVLTPRERRRHKGRG